MHQNKLIMLRVIFLLFFTFFLNIGAKANENCPDKNPEIILDLGGTSEPEKIVYSTYDKCTKQHDYCGTMGCSLEVFYHNGELAKSYTVKDNWYIRPVNVISQKPTYELIIPMSYDEQRVISIIDGKFTSKIKEISHYRDEAVNRYRIKDKVLEHFAKEYEKSGEVIKKEKSKWIAQCYIKWDGKVLVDDEDCIIKTEDAPIELFDEFSVFVVKSNIDCVENDSKDCSYMFEAGQYKHLNKYFWQVALKDRTMNRLLHIGEDFDIEIYLPRKEIIYDDENGTCFVRNKKEDMFCFVHDGMANASYVKY